MFYKHITDIAAQKNTIAFMELLFLNESKAFKLYMGILVTSCTHLCIAQQRCCIRMRSDGNVKDHCVAYTKLHYIVNPQFKKSCDAIISKMSI